MPKHTAITIVVIALAVLIIALVLSFTNLNTSPHILAQLQSQYQDFKVTQSTFQGYESKKASANTANGKILLRVVENVANESLADVILELNSQITKLGEKITYFDPYKGETVEYSVPDEFRPVEEEISIKGNFLKYHIVYANEIFSYFVFSKEKASFRGIVLVFNCGRNVYKIEIFSKIDAFNKDALLVMFLDLYCP